MDDKGKEKVTEDYLSDDESVYNEGDDLGEYMEEFDEEFEDDEADTDDYDQDAMSFDDDEFDEEADEDGLIEENPFELDAPPQAALLDFDAPEEAPYSNLEPLSLKDVLPPGSKRRARPDFKAASSMRPQ